MNSRYIDGDETLLIKKEIDNPLLSIDEDPQKLIDFISEISEKPIFANGIIEQCVKHGFEGDPGNDKDISDFIIQKAKNNGVIITSKDQNVFKTNIGNWLKEGQVEMSGKIKAAPDDNVNSRVNVYKLCFALGLNFEETEEFFLKKYLCRAFNLRSIYETVVFYALRNEKDYRYVNDLLDKISNLDGKNGSHNSIYTENFRSGIVDNIDEDEFIAYCAKNKNYFEQCNLTAVEEIKMLLDDSYEILANELYDADCTDRVSYVLREIYGGEPSFYDKNEKKWKKSEKSSADILKKMRLNAPKRIYARMPSEQEVSKIKNGELVSNELLRKTLILLNFYNFFMTAGDDNSEDYYEDFVEEMNSILEKCGFIQTYARNPYDWVFMYCAKQLHPVETFKAILDVYFSIE